MTIGQRQSQYEALDTGEAGPPRAHHFIWKTSLAGPSLRQNSPSPKREIYGLKRRVCFSDSCEPFALVAVSVPGVETGSKGYGPHQFPWMSTGIMDRYGLFRAAAHASGATFGWKS